MAWEGKVWHGGPQREDKSPTNIRACFAFLKSRPYLSEEDRERLELLEVVEILKSK
jgi:hypothetical protein